MDPRLLGFSSSTNGIQFRHQSTPFVSNAKLIGGPRFENTFINHNFGQTPFLDHSPCDTVPTSTVTSEEDAHEDCDFSDALLRYISQILMEEDMEDKTCMLQGSSDLQAAEQSFYEVLGKKYPPSPERNWVYIGQNSEIPDDCLSRNYSNHITSSINGNGYSIDQSWISIPEDCNTISVQNLPMYNSSYSFASSSTGLSNTLEGLLDSPISPLQAADSYRGNQSICQFRKGAEEASKFLPDTSGLVINFREPKGESSEVVFKDEIESLSIGLTGRKNPYRENIDLEERSSKMAANYPESTVRSKVFDEVLLCNKEKGILQAYREALRNETNKKMEENRKSKGKNGKKGRGKRQNGKKEVIDLRTLLIHCAQAVAADDHRSASELIKQIRQHSSPLGDGNQRLAHCFADGLEARVAGTGSQIYKALLNKRTTASDYLKAYHLYLASCPFRKISNFVSNRTILLNSENKMTIHIVDFGILYGFQWPTFIQRISLRDGGSPRLRITGIEIPQPGFRPSAGVEETGSRLADYARSFNVPFEYNAVAKRWDTVELEDLKIEKGEFLVVNCLYRAETLHDETLSGSSRDKVLDLIRKISPDIFIHGIVNGAYNAPFFVTRFREALFHFSALFDMLEANVPREHHERMLIEREIFGKEALNVIACEGWERVERPETYKQWQARILRAGFGQSSFDRETKMRAKDKVRSVYHKDFVIDEDSQWLLQGWKGRIIYALSCWKPV